MAANRSFSSMHRHWARMQCPLSLVRTRLFEEAEADVLAHQSLSTLVS